MPEQTHTPGPWELGKGATAGFVSAPMLGSKIVANLIFYGAGQKRSEVEANGHLIAAAPDLLAACELGDSVGNNGPALLLTAAELLKDAAPVTSMELCRKAHAEAAAIAKARGQDAANG